MKRFFFFFAAIFSYDQTLAFMYAYKHTSAVVNVPPPFKRILIC